MLELAGARVSAAIASGSDLAAGAPILDATGPAGALHRAWKASQTLVEYASGIATAARRIVEAARAARPDIAIVCTRKNMPSAKALAIKSILAGGAMPHRLGLSETILIFAEHRVFFGGRTAAAMIAQAQRGARKGSSKSRRSTKHSRGRRQAPTCCRPRSCRSTICRRSQTGLRRWRGDPCWRRQVESTRATRRPMQRPGPTSSSPPLPTRRHRSTSRCGSNQPAD